MAKLKVMRANVKTRYAAEGRDRCTVCDEPIQVGESYVTKGGRSYGKNWLLYCRTCAMEKGII